MQGEIDNEYIFGTEDIDDVIDKFERASEMFSYSEELYKNIPVGFLVEFFGDDFINVIKRQYGNDMESLLEDYKYEYEEFMNEMGDV